MGNNGLEVFDTYANVLVLFHNEAFEVQSVNGDRCLQRLLEDLCLYSAPSMPRSWRFTVVVNNLLGVAREVHPPVFVKHVQVLCLSPKVLGKRPQCIGPNCPSALHRTSIKLHAEWIRNFERELVGFLYTYFNVGVMLRASLTRIPPCR